ncbi:MAG: response regulator transcription factor [Sphingobacteriales bacterium]|nr:MAG: response regulator transcription factor [Sphingobacteriales bacterium]
MPLKCIVVDDEPLAVKLLADYVTRTPVLECITATTDVLLALRLVQEKAADLIFLDIQMPELTGLQFMKIIRNSCSVVITSAYPQYAIDGFEHNVADYLLKPVTYERFLVAVNKAVARSAASIVPAVHPSSFNVPDHIFIKTSNKLQRIDLAEILYIEALRDYIAIHLPKQKILSLESMKNILTILPQDRFTPSPVLGTAHDLAHLIQCSRTTFGITREQTQVRKTLSFPLDPVSNAAHLGVTHDLALVVNGMGPTPG